MRITPSLLSLGLLVCTSLTVNAAPKNVILMISDGWGYNQITATNAYVGTTPAYMGADFVSFAMKTNSANNPAGYDPATAWVSDGAGGLKPNYEYFKNGLGATDSASAITAIMTGIKNYDGQVNWSTAGLPLTTLAENFKAAGRAVGAISTVEWSHATPAGIVGHNSSRNNYSQIAVEVVNSSIDVVMGAGNPEYNDNSQPANLNAQYVGGTDTWNALKAGTAGGTNPWTLIQDRSAFQALATGNTPKRVLGTFKSYTTAQQARSGDSQVVDIAGLKSAVPTLAEMSKAALNVLDNNTKGYFIMIEGGAVDWAGHANQKGRVIEEQIDFNNAVDAVISYVNANSNWQDTLLIVTGDHETGLLLGLNGETGIVTKGVGVMPDMKFFSTGHSNQLVPIYVRGAGSDMLTQYAVGNDPVRGKYIDNTDVYKVMNSAASAVELSVNPGPGYLGNLSGVNLNYNLDGPTKLTGSLSLDNSGKMLIGSISPGLYSLQIAGGHWVKRTISGITVDGIKTVSTQLANGDADGNGQVNLFDYVELDKKFGSSDAMADLDGDGMVNLFDYVIIDQNFGALAD